MIPIPDSLIEKYVTHLNEHNVLIKGKADNKKWLLYFLDFCSKYKVIGSDQERLLGDASLKTTMIYTHCVPVRTIKEPRSPLDF